MKLEAAIAFREALLGLQTMHHGGWMHRDLKLSNIGLVGIPARAILLDNGTSARLSPGTKIKPSPGFLGTVGYLAPERELESYDHSIDIWAMGIVLYYLTYNDSPWGMSLNPWRDPKDPLHLSQFSENYAYAIDRMRADYNAARQAPRQGYIHREYSLHAWNFFAMPRLS